MEIPWASAHGPLAWRLQRTAPMSNTGWSILFGVALLVLAGACTDQDAYATAAHRAASRLGVAETALRVTQRSDLSTDGHAVLRITEKGSRRQVMVAVANEGHALVDSTAPDAFARLARAEQLGARFDQFGAARVAGWFGAFGGRCGEPIITRAQGVGVHARADGGHELRFQFAGAGRVEQCDLVLDRQGQVESVNVRPLPAQVASRSS
jgi:hypothetical protein